MGKKALNVLERTDDLRNVAKEISKEKGVSYEDAFAEAKNKKGVIDMMEIGDINKYGEPSYYYKEAVATFGDNVNGVPTETISPEKLEVLITANKMGADIIDFKKNMSASDLKKQTVNSRREKEKTKEKDKILILKKPNNRKDVNAA